MKILILSPKEHELLDLLAKRSDPLRYENSWRESNIDELNIHYKYKMTVWTCMICGEKWKASAHKSYLHGIKHLQESNLLPFI